ncbi:MAG: hypothetical protein POELPBGB_03926 [Bacteroidia bacterium]|nr:hypothetical protein [Bacteroidia bacterium]
MKRTLLFLSFLLAHTTQINAQALEWAKNFGVISTNGNFGFRDMETDYFGNVFVVGEIPVGTYDFDPDTSELIYTTSTADSYLAKYSSKGKLIFVKFITGSVAANSIEIDNAGNVLICGISSGLTDYDPSDAYYYLPAGGFFAKYSSQGDFIFAKTIVGALINSIETDNNQNIYICGYYNGTCDFDPAPTTAYLTGSEQMFLAEYTPTGSIIFAKSTEGAGTISLDENPMKIDVNGDIIVCGNFHLQIDFDLDISQHAVIGDTPGSGSCFLAKYASDGTFIDVVDWHNYFEVFSLDCDNSGNIYLTGRCSDSADLDPSANVVQGQLNGGVFFLKLDPQLNLVYGNTIDGLSSGFAYDIAVNNDGSILLAGLAATNQFDFDPSPNTYTLPLNNGFGYFAKYDPLGGLVFAAGIEHVFNDRVHVLSDDFGNVLIGGNALTDSADFDTGESEYYLFEEFGDVFFASYSFSSNSVSGVVYKDYNSNGMQDANEPFKKDVMLKATPTGKLGNTYANGRYYIYLDNGSYSVTVPEPPLYYTANPTNQNIVFNGTGQSDTTKHFGLQPIGNIQDIEIFFTQFSTFTRPGFWVGYKIKYRNIGTVSSTPTINLNHDSHLVFQNSTLPYTTYSSNTLSWILAALEPDEEGEMTIWFRAENNTPLGSTLTNCVSAVTIEADYNPLNNQDCVDGFVSGSFDPNDKQVSPEDYLTPEQVVNGEYLTYTIRFQNTGTDTAFTVVVIDTLDLNLNIPSFENISASHTFSWELKNENIIWWTFDNILLPDSNTNEPESHGFIKYRIKSNNDLILGDSVQNNANIYFDYNEPVLTNTTLNIVATPVNVDEAENINSIIYPNPATTEITIIGYSPAYLKLSNTVGQTVAESKGNKLYVGNLSQGLYLLQLFDTNGQTVKTEKVIITK